MAMLIVQLKVKDYRKWRRVYDAQAPARRKATMGSAQVYRDADDPRKLAIVFKIKDIGRAKEYLDSDRLKEAMRMAGVIGKPTRTFVQPEAQPIPSPGKTS